MSSDTTGGPTTSTWIDGETWRNWTHDRRAAAIAEKQLLQFAALDAFLAVGCTRERTACLRMPLRLRFVSGGAVSNLETMAFLHAHGLDVEPKGLVAALRAALEAAQVRYYGAVGDEGLTAAEIEVARSGGLDDEPVSEATDPLLQGVIAYAALVHAGLTTRKAAERLGVTDARIRQRLRDRSLLALRAGKSWHLPEFQFTRKGELPGWGEVCPHLPASTSPVALERWLALPHPDLVVGDDETPASPRDWLMAGRPPQAVASLAAELA